MNSKNSKVALRIGVFALALQLVACAPEDPTFVPVPVRDVFDVEVMPVLARDCAFPACHGDPDRALVVYAPGRARLDEATDSWAAMTLEESEANYQRALSMLVGSARAERTLLVDKPLSTAAGGASHQGVDERGRDVYGSPDDAGYGVLRRWAASALSEAP